jgi:sugar lactone lactonase YvrE
MKTKVKILCDLFSGAILLMASCVSAQNLFEADGFSGNIYEFTPSGVQSTFASGLQYPESLAFNGGNDLFVGTENVDIYKFTPGGVQSTFDSGLVNYPYALAVDHMGNLFVSLIVGHDGTIFKITPGGVQSTFADGFLYPAGLAFDHKGDLFVADGYAGTIIEITTGGAQSTFASGLTYPTGLAFNTAGDLFVSGSISGTITEITPSGVQSTFASGLNNEPWGLAFNSAGNLFVAADSDNLGQGTIIEITPGGVQSTFASGLSGPLALAFPHPPVLVIGFTGLQTNGTFQFNVAFQSSYFGFQNSTIIQASTNLVNWYNIYTNTPPFAFIDSNAVEFSCRFYRALLGP